MHVPESIHLENPDLLYAVPLSSIILLSQHHSYTLVAESLTLRQHK